MSPHRVRAMRLASQRLSRPSNGTASRLVHALGAVQAQDYAGAKWALGQRIAGATDAAIEEELTSGRILRTHVLRPTWHFVAPEDIRWLLALTGPRVSAAMASYNRKLELDAAVFRRSRRAIERALEGGRHLTRTEIASALQRARIGALPTQRLAHLMLQAELDALVCSGPRQGKQSTYALLEERVPPARSLERDEALVELACRYFRTRGPATVRDFAWWSGLAMANARRAISASAETLEELTVNDHAHWVAADRASPGRLSASAHLLPNYDEYFIGYKDRSAIGHRIGDAALVTGGDASVAHVVLVDGELVGGWKRADERGGVVLRLRLVARVTTAERKRIASAAERLAVFLGLPVRVEETSP